MKGSFNLLVRKPRGKILGDECKNLYDNGKNLSERICNRYSKKSNHFQFKFFKFFLNL